MASLTPKQEKFCRKYIELGNASEAYRQSYDAARMKMETVNREAKTLLDNPKIATRISALQGIHQKKHEITVDKITEFLIEDRALGYKTKQPGAVVSATMGLAKVHGLLMDKLHIERKLEDLTDDELSALARSKGLLDRKDSDRRGAGEKAKGE